MRISDWSSDVCSSDLQPRAGAVIAAVDDVGRLVESGDAAPVDPPDRVGAALDRAAEGAHGVGGRQHDLALEQSLDEALADREAAEEQRPVRDRLVTRHPERSDRKSTRLNSSHQCAYRMQVSAGQKKETS